MESRFFILCLVIFVAGFWYCQGTTKRSYYAVMDSVDFKIVKPELVEGNITLAKYDDRNSGMNAHIYFKTDATNFKVIINTYVMKDGKYRPIYVNNKTEDLCAYLRRPTFLYFIHFLYPQYQKNGNFPKSCPIRKGHYYFNNASFNEAALPPAAPLGNYKITLEFVPMKQLMCTISICVKLISNK